MAEIMEVIEDTTDDVKKAFKKKPIFFIACGAVALFALYKLLKKDEVYYDEDGLGSIATDAVGYEGYPTMSESMLDYDALYEQLVQDMTFDNVGGGAGSGSTSAGAGTVGESTSNIEQLDKLIDKYEQLVTDRDEMRSEYDSIIMEKDEEISSLNSKLTYTESKGNVISQMQTNSEAWKNATTQAEREALAQANQELGKSIGATYDSKSGTWWDNDGSRLYLTAGEVGSTNSGAVHSTVVAQMQANSEAWHKASTQAERDALSRANKTLGESIGATYDAGSGKWYSKNGTELLVYSDSKPSQTTTVLKGASYSEPSSSYTKVVTPNLTGNAQAFENYRNDVVGQATYTQVFDPVTQTAGAVSVSRDYNTNEYGGKNSVSVKGNTMTITQTDKNNKVVSKTTQKVASPISTIIEK